jgi:hypothetical protein
MTASPSTTSWRSIHLPHLVGLPLLPVGAGDEGKAPIDPDSGRPMTAWPKASWSPKTIASTDSAVVTAVGARFGPDAGGLLCVDVDGAPALESLLAAGCDPDSAGWRITRSTAPDRMKVVFRVPPEQWPTGRSKQRGKVVTSCGDGSQIEWFFGSGQAVVAGLHQPSGVELEWSGGPDSITELPEPWLALWRSAGPKPAQRAQPAAAVTTADGIPLETLLPRELEQLARNGAADGERNQGIFKLAAAALAIYDAALAAGLTVDGSPEALVLAAATRCSPPLPESEALSCLQSAESQPRDPDPGWTDRLRFQLNRRSRSTRPKPPRSARSAGGGGQPAAPLPATFMALIEALPDGWAPSKDGPPQPSRLSVGELAGMLQRQSDRLRFNEMSLLAEVETTTGWCSIVDADMDSAYVLLSQKGWIIGAEPIVKAVCHVARLRKIHPVRQYLLRIEQDASITPYDLDRVGPDVFRAVLPLHAAMVRKWLVGAVARALDPGCQMDYCLVLQSRKQGIHKSTSLRDLASPDWFTSTVPDQDKDFLLNVHSCWIFELAELESVTGRRESGRLKNLITTSVDMFRQPYGKTAERNKRGSVFCGTVNEETFLRDNTGNRRFWVVPIAGDEPINRDAIRAARDGIWKAALLAYRSGELPMLPKDLAVESEAQNEQFTHEDPWLAMLQAWIDGNPIGAQLAPESRITLADASQPFSTAEALHAAGVKRLDQISRSDETRVAPLLRQLGFEKGKQSRRDGKHVRLWSRVTTVTTCPIPPAYGVVTAKPTVPQSASAAVPTVTTYLPKGVTEISGSNRDVARAAGVSPFMGTGGCYTPPDMAKPNAPEGISASQPPRNNPPGGCDTSTTTDWVAAAVAALHLEPHAACLPDVMAWLATHGAPAITKTAATLALDRLRADDGDNPLFSAA